MPLQYNLIIYTSISKGTDKTVDSLTMDMSISNEIEVLINMSINSKWFQEAERKCYISWNSDYSYFSIDIFSKYCGGFLDESRSFSSLNLWRFPNLLCGFNGSILLKKLDLNDFVELLLIFGQRRVCDLGWKTFDFSLFIRDFFLLQMKMLELLEVVHFHKYWTF
jgi:hypothetical protein